MSYTLAGLVFAVLLVLASCYVSLADPEARGFLKVDERVQIEALG